MKQEHLGRALDRDELAALVELATRLGLLGDARSTLLQGLPAGFIHSLEQKTAPDLQLRADLHRLNETDPLTGLGRRPIAIWLENAARLTQARHLPEVTRLAELLRITTSTSMRWPEQPAMTMRALATLRLASLAPLLSQLGRLGDPAPPDDLRPPPPDKLHHNLLSPHVEMLLRAGMSRVRLVQRFFEQAAPGRRSQVVADLQGSYRAARQSNLAPDDVFMHLQRCICGPEPRSEELAGALVIMAFFFEQCDIFERTPSAAESS